MMTISPDPAQTLEGDGLAVRNPFTGDLIQKVPVSTADEVSQAVRSARRAFTTWSHTRLTDRQLVYQAFVILLRDNGAEVAALLTAETGQPITDSFAEVEEAISYFSDTIGESNAFYGQVYPHGAEAISASFLQYTVNEPLGVVAVVMDDEAPILSFAYQVASTLLGGNTVIVDSTRSAPLAVMRVAEMLQEAELPAAALQVLVTNEEGTAHLISSSGINGLSFHGTSDAAIEATEAARANLTRVVALGNGNDAVVVFDDGDLDSAAAEIARAAFANAGRNRAAVKRVFVQNSVRSTFTQKLIAATRSLVVGDPTDPRTQVGPLRNEDDAQATAHCVSEAVSHGARVLIGGTVAGAVFSPTVMDIPNGESPLGSDELIGRPVVTVRGFGEDADAYALANASVYGFGAGVFTSDIQRAGTAATRLEANHVVINGAGDYRGRRVPFGGVKKSGVGVESLLATPRATTETKTILAADIYDFAAVNTSNTAGRHT